MKRKLLAVAAVVTALVGLVAAGAVYSVSASNKEAARWESVIFPQEGKQDGHGFFKHRVVGRIMAHVAGELKLTEDQKTEIHGILAAERQNVMPLFGQLHEAKKEYDGSAGANAGGGFDEARARAFAARQAQTIGELIVAKERVKSKVFAVLTPEQRQKAHEMHGRFHARIGDHFKGSMH